MCDCDTCIEFLKLLKPCKCTKYVLRRTCPFLTVCTLRFADRDFGTKHDFNCVVLSKSDVNQFIVFVQAFMQRLVKNIVKQKTIQLTIQFSVLDNVLVVFKIEKVMNSFSV